MLDTNVQLNLKLCKTLVSRTLLVERVKETQRLVVQFLDSHAMPLKLPTFVTTEQVI